MNKSPSNCNLKNKLSPSFIQFQLINLNNIFSQILECNGISFANIDLAEAVVHLKSGKELDLLIRKGSHDLLTGESSGYDSSSGASANGRHSDKPKSKVIEIFSHYLAIKA